MNEKTKTNTKKYRKYFDKLDNNEESIIEIDDETQIKYEKLEQIYHNICNKKQIYKAKEESLKERERLEILNNEEFVYGEITFRTMSYIFEVIKKNFGKESINEGNFYDLGCVIFNNFLGSWTCLCTGSTITSIS